MNTYQTQTPLTSNRYSTIQPGPAPSPRPPTPPLPPRPVNPATAGLALEIIAEDLAAEMREQFIGTLRAGFWWCKDCDARCEREEGENGQPAGCGACGSPRITFHRPIQEAP